MKGIKATSPTPTHHEDPGKLVYEIMDTKIKKKPLQTIISTHTVHETRVKKTEKKGEMSPKHPGRTAQKENRLVGILRTDPAHRRISKMDLCIYT